MPSGSGSGSEQKFRRAILKNLLLGLRKEAGAAASMCASFGERKDAIRRAADAALAAARGTAPRWSRSLAAELSQGRRRRRHRNDDDDEPRLQLRAAKGAAACRKVSRRRLRARPKSSRLAATAKAAGAIARVMMVRRRAGALREIVPGGRGMADECTLLGETLDYAVSLKAQVDAMQILLRTLQQQAPARRPASMLKQHQ